MSSPRPRLLSTSSCLLVSNLERSIAFYCDQLGFGEPVIWGEPACFAIVNRDGFDIMLNLSPIPDRIRPNGPDGFWDLYLRVEDARVEADLLRASGVPLDIDLAETEYQMTEFEVVDPDGYRICFGSPND